MPDNVCNIAAYLPLMAQRVPDQPAVVGTSGRDRNGRACYTKLSFRELEARSNRYANGLSSAGIGRGTRVLVMVRPGLGFIGLIFALFKIGAVPILIDPGMGIKRLLECVRHVKPQAFVGIPLAHAVRVLRPSAFGAVKHVVTVGRRWFWGGPTLGGLAERASSEFEMVPTRADETAAILFTSGSTGPAKGVVYEHGMFDAQVRAIQTCYGIEPGEVDLPAFPLFALFSTAMGMTCVIPDMDPSRPATVEPAKIVEAIQDHAVTNTFGSPAIWNRVAQYCVQRGITLPTLRRVLIAGAPVSYQLIEQMHQVLNPSADVHTPYGATESLPVSSISGREVLDKCRESSRQGAGTCVGRPLPGITLRIIRISDEPIDTWSDDLVLCHSSNEGLGVGVAHGFSRGGRESEDHSCPPPLKRWATQSRGGGESADYSCPPPLKRWATQRIGEIVVRGDVVTKEYDGLPQATAQAKIKDGQSLWHRIGDVGYLDEAGRLWFCGRKAHRVSTENTTMFTVPCEAVFNEHPEVYRSALVGVGLPGRQEPVIVIEPEPGKFPSRTRMAGFQHELLELGQQNELTCSIKRVLFHRAFPVDVRHNAKIDREALACWAAEQLR